MCGIAGLFNPDTAIDPAVVRRMQESMIHRGPDGEGFYSTDMMAMAMRRLAIIDRSGGDQPVYNEAGDIAVVYNGEIYNHHDLRKSLQRRGHRFKSRVDTEVIVHLYEEEGPECVRKLDGMFAFSLWDEKKKTLLLARDRFGVKPLYYSRMGHRLSWASEINTLLQDAFIPRDIDAEALNIYLSLYYIPSPWTIYRAVRALRPAHYMLVTPDSVRTVRYWSPTFGGSKSREPELCHKIREFMSHAVKETLESEVPLGIFLSGGLDSTGIAKYAQASTGRLKTYSLGFPDATYDERPLARLVAERYGADHHEFELAAQDVPAILRRLVSIYGQPFGDWSAVANYRIAELAKATSTVILRGDGGDELFGGYPTLLASGIVDKYLMLPKFLRHGLRKAIEKLPSSDSYMSLDFRLKRFVAGARGPAEISHLAWKEILSQEQREALTPLVRDLKADPFELLTRPLLEEMAQAEAAEETGLLDRLLYIDARVFLEGCGLITSDHVAMAHSIETRVPFLTNDMIDFAFSIPAAMKVRGMTTKYIFRQALKDILPPQVLAAPKRGFVLPSAAWLKGPLRTMVEETLVETPDYIDRDVTWKIWQDHLHGRRDSTRQLTMLLNLVMWAK